MQYRHARTPLCLPPTHRPQPRWLALARRLPRSRSRRSTTHRCLGADLQAPASVLVSGSPVCLVTIVLIWTYTCLATPLKFALLASFLPTNSVREAVRARGGGVQVLRGAEAAAACVARCAGCAHCCWLAGGPLSASSPLDNSQANNSEANNSTHSQTNSQSSTSRVLVVFPALCNFSGTRYDVNAFAQALPSNALTLCDAAAWAATQPLDLSVWPGVFLSGFFWFCFGFLIFSFF